MHGSLEVEGTRPLSHGRALGGKELGETRLQPRSQQGAALRGLGGPAAAGTCPGLSLRSPASSLLPWPWVHPFCLLVSFPPRFLCDTLSLPGRPWLSGVGCHIGLPTGLGSAWRASCPPAA